MKTQSLRQFKGYQNEHQLARSSASPTHVTRHVIGNLLTAANAGCYITVTTGQLHMHDVIAARDVTS
jgi:hypothetical protein